MKSYEWQKSNAWLQTGIAAIIAMGTCWHTTAGVLVAVGIISSVWLTVADHKHGVDPDNKELSGSNDRQRAEERRASYDRRRTSRNHESVGLPP
jgi:hypothetical protein